MSIIAPASIYVKAGILFIFPVALDRLDYGAVYEAVDALAPAFGMGFYYVLFAFGNPEFDFFKLFGNIFIRSSALRI